MQQQKTSHWLIAFRVIFTAALLACILFIFRNSIQTGEVSSARSQAVTALVNGFLGKFGLGPLSEHIIRKLAHFSEFMLEGFLLMLCLRVYTRHFVRHISWPLLAGMSTALMDETIQISIPNRTSSVTDVWIAPGTPARPAGSRHTIVADTELKVMEVGAESVATMQQAMSFAVRPLRAMA